MKNSKALYIAIAILVIVIGSAVYYVGKNKGVKGVKTVNTEENGNASTPTVEAENPADKFGPNETKLTDETVASFISSNKLVIVDFYLSTCPHCQTAAPILSRFADEYKDKVKVGKIEVRENPKVADTYQIDSVPQFFLFKDGQKIDSLTGSDVTVDSFKAMVDKALK